MKWCRDLLKVFPSHSRIHSFPILVALVLPQLSCKDTLLSDDSGAKLPATQPGPVVPPPGGQPSAPPGAPAPAPGAGPSVPGGVVPPPDGAVTPPAPAVMPVKNCGATLQSRLAISTIDLGGVQVNRGALGPRRSDLDYGRSLPVHFAAAPDGSGRAGWVGSDNRIHITPLTSDDKRAGPDILIEGAQIRGLVAHNDSTTVLSFGSDQHVYLTKLGADGSQIWRAKLTGTDGKDGRNDRVSDIYHGRLVYNATSDLYGAYFNVHHGGHEGDKLRYLTSGGELQANQGWEWGCSHSIHLRLHADGAGFKSVCVSDAFPSTGVHFHHRENKIADAFGDERGIAYARFGGMVKTSAGYAINWLKKDTSAGAWRLEFATYRGAAMPPVKELFAGASKDSAYLAPYGTQQLLVGYVSGGQLYGALMDSAAANPGTPEALAAEIGEGDDMLPHTNGDVMWAYAWGNLGQLKVMRLSLCP